MKLPRFFGKSRGGAERVAPEPTQPDAKIDPLESIKGYLAGDIKGHPYRDQLITEINQLDKTKDLPATKREELVNEILARRDKIAAGRQ